MASSAEIGQNLPDTLPADFGDWDNPEIEPAPAPEPAAEPAPPQRFVPAEARSQYPSASHSAAPPAARPSTPPRAFAAAAPTAPRVPSAPASAYPVAGAYLRRLRSLNAAERAPEPSAKAEPNAYTRAAEIREMQRTVTDETSASLPSDSHFRALFHSGLTIQEEDERPEHGSGKKWKIIFAVATGSILLAAFQFFHSGAPSGMGRAADRTTVAAKVNTGIESTTATTANTTQQAGSVAPATLTASASTPQDNVSAASESQEPSGPNQTQARMMREQLMAPARIPQSARGGAPADTAPGNIAGMEALNGSSVNNVFNGQARPNVRAAVQQPLMVSAGIAAGMLIYQTAPVYPPIAKAARVSGTVVIHAMITRSGAVSNARAVSGPAMLQPAALEAVRTWRFRPYKLNNQPTEVETTVNVNFTLGR